mmetsp:Transcript_33773/g.77913  ORF Transcript_33773/g.77913 Transcript_33773/m.77913 type:complete len:286 (-) Transcript_33773:366-1223(-)
MMSASFSSQAMEMAGTMSVPRSMHRMSTVERGRGVWMVMKTRKGAISGMLDERVYAMDFLRLSKMRRPSSTPRTMEAKLSSRRIMSAAVLDTSVPAIPMATPMSAFLRAGASFTPSPVTATTSFSSSWNAFTIWSFWAGEVRAKTISECLKMKRHLDSGVSGESSQPGTTIALDLDTSSPRSLILQRSGRVTSFPEASRLVIADTTLKRSVVKMLTILAMAAAVWGWSPVTMTTRIPARWQESTESGTAGRGGSMRATIPTRTSLRVARRLKSARCSSPRSSHLA